MRLIVCELTLGQHITLLGALVSVINKKVR